MQLEICRFLASRLRGSPHSNADCRPDRSLNLFVTGRPRREPGVLSYQRFVSEDGTIIHLYERYADSATAVAHLERPGDASQRQLSVSRGREKWSSHGA
jgi:hypothetical protein